MSRVPRLDGASRAVRRLPVAGLLALLIVLAADWLVLGDHGPWEHFAARIPKLQAIHGGVANDRRDIGALARVAEGRSRVFVVGSSRAAAGFAPAAAERQLPGVEFARLAHPGIDPFIIRALTDDMIEAGADAVVFVLSEVDTHRPVRLEPVPGPTSAAANLSAVADLLAETGPEFAWRNRGALYRLLTAAALRGYRYREVLGHAGLAPLSFPFDTRLGSAPPDLDRLPPIALGRPRRASIPPDVRERINALYRTIPQQWRAWAVPEIAIMRELGPGEHVAVQLALLRRSVERLRAAGVEVVLVEGPLHPIASELYPAELREEFRAFARSLEADHAVHFVSLDAMRPFAASDFSDLLHTTWTGALKLTSGVVAGLRAVLPEAPQSGGPSPDPTLETGGKVPN